MPTSHDRKQIQRPFARSPEREEEVIRSRFDLYAKLPTRKIETLESIEKTLENALAILGDRIDRMKGILNANG